MAPQHSGLQREVLALYRRALRMVRTKPPSSQPKFLLHIRHTFRTQSTSVSPRALTTVEHLLRRGRRTLETLESSAVRDVSVSDEMRAWGVEAGRRVRIRRLATE